MKIDFSNTTGSPGTLQSPPSVATISTQTISIGVAYSFTPTVQNPSGFSLSFSVTGGSLPTGLSISSSTGAITGTPTVGGTTNGLQIRVSYNSTHIDSNAFSMIISEDLTFGTVSNQSSLINESFTLNTEIDSALTHTYSLQSGTLPTGLSLDTSTGHITGTPTVAATSSGLVIRAIFDTFVVDSNSFSIQVKAAPSIAAITNKTGYVNDVFSFTPSLTNPDSVSVVWSETGMGTQPGLSFNTSTGAITGTPTSTSFFAHVLRVTFGNSSHVDTNQFSVTVLAAPSIATIADQTEQSGTSFSFTPSVTNTDSVTLTYSLATGSLPTGISLNSSTGEISGTPTDTTTTSYQGISIRVSYGVSASVVSNVFGFVVTATASRTNLGVNLAEMVDYGAQFAFKNMVKQGRGWTPSSGTLSLDSTGYPLSLAAGQSARMYWITSIPNSSTTYTETHQGFGTFTRTNQASTQMFWDLTATTVNNELHDIKMFIPGTSDPDDTQPFYQPFLDMCSGFGLLRFMDWDSTNLNQIVNWSDRTTVDWYSYTGGTSPQKNGHNQQTTVPYEHMISLCNAVSADMWICVPSAASDDFITQLATLIYNNLDQSLKCYWELSNEVWNGSFYGNQYFAGRAAALGLAAGFTGIMQAYSLRCVQMYTLVDAVYGVNTSRRKRVMGAQTGNLGTITQPLSYQNAYQHVDYLAIAPYLLLNLPAGATQSDIQTHIYASNDGYTRNVTDVNASKASAATYGIPLAFYEFGPGFPNSSGDANTAAYFTYNIGANMEQSMKDYIFKVWYQAGEQCPACWYHLCAPQGQFDWGLCRTVLDTNTAKMRAIDGYLGVAPSTPPAVQAPIIGTITDKTITQNVAYSFTPDVTNPSSLTQSFSISGTLPTGLSISSVDGTISGTPTVVQTKTGLSIHDGYSGAASGTVISNTFSIDVQSGGSGPVAGYTAWFDPSDAANITVVSGGVSQLNDKSGNNYHATQANAGNRPTTSTINSLTCLSHPWNGLFLTSTTGTNLMTTTAYTVFAVIKATNITSNASDYNNNCAWGFEANDTAGLYFSSGTPSALALSDDGALDQAAATIALNTAYVICVKKTATLISISINGGAFTDVSSGTASSLAYTFNIGRGIGASPWFIGSIGEMLTYNTTLSGGNISSNVTYLRNKWGI